MKDRGFWVPAGSFVLAILLSLIAGPASGVKALSPRDPGSITAPRPPKNKFLLIILEGTFVESYHAGSDDGEGPTESLKLNFSKFQYEYFQQSKENTPPEPPFKKFSLFDRILLETVYVRRSDPSQSVTLLIEMDEAHALVDGPGPVTESSMLSFTTDDARRAVENSGAQAAQALGAPLSDVQAVTTIAGGSSFAVRFVAEAASIPGHDQADPVVKRIEVTLSPAEDAASFAELP
jgi:hypothetical protein